MRALLYLLSAAALTGCADEERALDAPPSARAPDGPGPYRIGVTTIQVTSAGRTLPIEIWYPAGAGGEPEQYVLKVGVLELTRIDSPRGARRDAKLDRRGAPYPTVLFSHGNGGTRIQSVYLTEFLASHGFVVAAPDHVGNTFAEQINQGNAIPAAKAAALRPGDVSRALDALLARSANATDPLSGAVDTAHLGVAGHSFGGFTALRVAGASIDAAAVLDDCKQNGGLVCDGWQDAEMPSSSLDARFIAAVAQAPGGAQAMFAGSRNGFADVAMPVLIEGGTLDALTPWKPEQEQPWTSLKGPASLLSVGGAGHFSFSDMCLLVENLGLSVKQFEDGCGPDNIPYADAHGIINRYTTAFFQHTLLGVDTSDVLDPIAPLPTGVASFQTK
ncbi:MAG: hypothetical protein IPI67_15420 [Myxococcales bacterium]|nr:hypothetical protein [Myxococcales bacterium]